MALRTIQRRQRGRNYKNDLIQFRVEMLVTFIFFNSMGFPGTYTRIFGHILETVVSYSAFLIEIALMLLFSGESFLEIRLLDIKAKYIPIYQFMLIAVVQSMLVTSDRSSQAITCLRLIVTILFAAWTLEHIPLSRIIELFAVAQMLLDVAILGLIVLRPGVAYISGGALRGVFASKNALAMELSFGAVILFLNLLGWRERMRSASVAWYGFFCVHILLLFMAQSVGAIATFMLVVMYYLFFSRLDPLRPPLGWGYIVVSISFLFFVFTILPLFAPLLQMLGKDATLTGRTELWDGIYRFMQSHNMLTGFGYGHFWVDVENVNRLHTMYDHTSYFSRMSTGAHNQLFELWLNVGLIGIGSYFYTIVGSLRYTSRMDRRSYMIISCMLLYLMIIGQTERVFEDAYSYHIVSFFIAMAAGCSSTPSSRFFQKNEVVRMQFGPNRS